MKRILLIITFLITNYTYIIAQLYYPLVDTNKVWSHLVCVYNPSVASAPICQTDLIKFSLDTAFDNHNYKKVFQTYDSALINWSIIGYIREDSLERVYYRKKTDTSETKFYDFNIHVNDSIFISQFQGLTVDTVDNIFFANKIRKRIKLQCIPGLPSMTETWIEGIGSLYGVLNSGYACYFGAKNSLLCFKENDTVKYKDPNYSSCFFNNQYLVNTIEYRGKVLTVKIIPNPTSDNITIESHREAVIEITNIQGQLIKTLSTTGNKTNIDVSTFPSGVYVVEVKTGKGVAVSKFIKE
jgi:hypothetical protein